MNANSHTSKGEEAYVKDCLEPAFTEEPETRAWNSDPAFQTVLGALNAGDNVKACREAETLAANFGDFADPYYWWGTALLRMGLLDRARQVLTEGLGRTKQKYLLCDCLGEVEWKARDIKRAVYWWAQGVHCQESLEQHNYGGDVGAYFHLHYVAEGLGLSECSSAFVVRVDQIRAGEIRLNAETANDLISLSRTAKNTSVAEVLRELVGRYIVPKKKAPTKAESAEVDRLIRQLEERDSLGWSSHKNVEAAERLGELGDPGALQALTRAMHDLSLELQVAAEQAIKRIKQANR